ncbi:MAG: hypothetical protein DRJ50_02595 [Actinobacteria bacterium]|nr:MAG: hypothetical protein DRJ50_02595 [Actinomycetota bacterium]
MQAFSATQRALLDARDDQVKMAVEFDDSTPIRLCTGFDPIVISGDTYTPKLRPSDFDKVALTNPKTARTKIVINDIDKAIRTQWYSTKLDCDATVFWYLRGSDGSWTNVLTVEWSVKKCSYDKNANFIVVLSAAAGSRPRAGGTIGSRSEFPYAPEPGESMRIGDIGITFRPGVGMPPPLPGGQQMAYDPGNRGTTGADGPGTTTDPTTGSGGGNQQAQGGSNASATTS